MKKVTFAIFLALFALLTVVGIRELQFSEAESNGSIICISCIGVG